jgi:hypothetical protein
VFNAFVVVILSKTGEGRLMHGVLANETALRQGNTQRATRDDAAEWLPACWIFFNLLT